MKNFILARVLRWIGKRGTGYRSLAFGLSAIFYGLMGAVRLMFSDLGDLGVDVSFLPVMTPKEIYYWIGGGIGWIGGTGKLEKIKLAIETNGKKKK